MTHARYHRRRCRRVGAARSVLFICGCDVCGCTAENDEPSADEMELQALLQILHEQLKIKPIQAQLQRLAVLYSLLLVRTDGVFSS
jgi:hypothetical protein